MENSTCPYCGYELIKGTVNAPLENFLFLPEGTNLSFFRTRWSKIPGATIIRLFSVTKKGDLFSPYSKQEAYMCSHCKKIIIDINDINSNNSK